MKFFAFHEAIETRTRMGDSVFRWLEVEAASIEEAATKIINSDNPPEYLAELTEEVGHTPVLQDYADHAGWGIHRTPQGALILFEDNTCIAIGDTKPAAAFHYCEHRISTEPGEVNVTA